MSNPTALECVQIGDAIYCQCGNPSAHYGTMGERGARVVKCEPPPPASLPSNEQLAVRIVEMITGDLVNHDDLSGQIWDEIPRRNRVQAEAWWRNQIVALLASNAPETNCDGATPVRCSGMQPT